MAVIIDGDAATIGKTFLRDDAGRGIDDLVMEGPTACVGPSHARPGEPG
jgi:hypothetical protein